MRPQPTHLGRTERSGGLAPIKTLVASFAHIHSLANKLNMQKDASSVRTAGPCGHVMLINAAPPSAELLD